MLNQKKILEAFKIEAGTQNFQRHLPKKKKSQNWWSCSLQLFLINLKTPNFMWGRICGAYCQVAEKLRWMSAKKLLTLARTVRCERAEGPGRLLLGGDLVSLPGRNINTQRVKLIWLISGYSGTEGLMSSW